MQLSKAPQLSLYSVEPSLNWSEPERFLRFLLFYRFYLPNFHLYVPGLQECSYLPYHFHPPKSLDSIHSNNTAQVRKLLALWYMMHPTQIIQTNSRIHVCSMDRYMISSRPSLLLIAKKLTNGDLVPWIRSKIHGEITSIEHKRKIFIYKSLIIKLINKAIYNYFI